MSKLDDLITTANQLLAAARIKDAIALLRRSVRPELDFQGELNVYERNLTAADGAFSQNVISFAEKSQTEARAAVVCCRSLYLQHHLPISAVFDNLRRKISFIHINPIK